MRMTWGSEADLSELDTKMGKLKARFLDKGVPIIVGEYGSSTMKELAPVRHYILTVAQKIYQIGMCPMLCDPGTHFNRRKLQFNDPELPKGFRKILGMKRD